MTRSMPESGGLTGMTPWTPWPLSRWSWWSAAISAKRLAALRICLSAVLLVDILASYWPHCDHFFGKDSLGDPALYAYLYAKPHWVWSILKGVTDHSVIRTAMIVWMVFTGFLCIGFLTRIRAVMVWVLSTSFANLNVDIDNAGDQIRGITLLYLMLAPSGAVWSIDALLQGRKRPQRPEPMIHPWPVRLLFIQLMCVYFFNGLFKVVGDDWLHGDSLYYVLCDLTLSRWSYAQWPLSPWVIRLLSWLVVAWELSFPLLVL